MTTTVTLLSALLLTSAALAQSTLPTSATTATKATVTKRPIRPSDVMRLQSIADPQVSPDGKWVAFVQSGVDVGKDKRNPDV